MCKTCRKCGTSSMGEYYSTTDHCGQVEILSDLIDPYYLARQIRQAGLDQGFNRDFRPSLGLISDLEIELPVDKNGAFDRVLMEKWTEFQNEIERAEDELKALLI